MNRITIFYLLAFALTCYHFFIESSLNQNEFYACVMLRTLEQDLNKF